MEDETDQDQSAYSSEEITAAGEAILSALQHISPLDDEQMAEEIGLERGLIVIAGHRLQREGLVGMKVGMRAEDDRSWLLWLVEQ